MSIPLAACSAPAVVGGSSFALGRYELPAAAVAPAAVAGPAAEGASLTVEFGHMLRQRRLLAMIADVETVRIKLSGNGVDQTVSIPKAQIVNGQTSHTFTGLPVGTLTVTIEALDATNQVLGHDVKSATVTAGGTTTVQSTLVLAPGAPANPNPLPPATVPGSGSGGGGASTGSLTTEVTLRDDVPLYKPAVQAVYQLAPGPIQHHALSVALDATGQAWFSCVQSFGTYRVGRVGTDGTVTAFTTGAGWAHRLTPGTGATSILTDNGTSGLIRFAPDGTYSALPAIADVAELYRVVERPDGSRYELRLYSTTLPWTAKLVHVASGGTETVLRAGDADSHLDDIAVDAAGDAALMTFHNTGGTGSEMTIEKLHPNGTSVFTRTYANTGGLFNDLAFDAAGHLFVLAAGKLHELAADGTPFRELPIAARASQIHIDASGRLWTYMANGIYSDLLRYIPAPAPDDVITRYGADGRIAAFYHVGEGVDTEQIAVSGDDLWVASLDKGLLHLKLGAEP